MFPEYELVDYDCQFNDLIFDLIGYKNLQTKYFETIYWFEFCHCCLLLKLITDHNLKLQFYLYTFTENPIN